MVIEFGHNDGGSLTPTDDGRTDCPGQGAQICYSEYDGVNETIYTFAATLEWASDLYLAKGAKVILSSQTPDNTWLVPLQARKPPPPHIYEKEPLL